MKKILKRTKSQISLFKFDLKMKLSALLLLTSMLGLQANESYAQRTKVTLDLKNITVEQLIDEIEDKTKFRFLYLLEDVNLKRIVSVKAKREKINSILDRIFLGTETTYRIDDRQISLVKRVKPKIKVKEQIQISVQGKITDKNGQPLPGASIIEKGTTNGTQTDFDGKFTLKVTDEKAVLIISYLGFITQEVSVEGKSNFSIKLEEDASDLDEVVVIGYGEINRRDLTTSISSIKVEEINRVTASSFDQALKGVASGLLVNQIHGAPGSAPSIRIRGINSISAGTSPIYVIDGVIVPIQNSPIGNASGTDLDQLTPSYTNILATINPNDIASVEVLKDAASTAVYGSRGSNGVIIINTKRGRSGEAKINFDYYSSVSSIVKRYPLTNAVQYANIVNEYSKEFNAPEIFSVQEISKFKSNGGTDWQNAVFRYALTQNFSISSRGGTDNLLYYLSGAFYDENGIVINNDLQRYSIRANLDVKLGKLKIGNSLMVSYTENDDVPHGSVRNPSSGPGIIGSILEFPPTDPIYNDDGTFFVVPTRSAQAITNPVAIAETQKIQYKTLRSLGNFFAEYEIIKGLKVRSSLGYDILTRTDAAFYPKTTTLLGIEVGGSARRNSSLSLNWLSENTASYNNVFGKHTVNGVVGATLQSSRIEGVFAGRNNLISDGFETFNLSGGDGELAPTSNLQEWNIASFLGRVSYNFDDKYFLTISGRYDGSSRLGVNDRYDFFPAVSAAWKINKEAFFEEVKQVSSLKLRVSYGVGGNDRIGNYPSLPSYNTTTAVFGENIAVGVRPGRLGNPDIKWERTAQLDIGLDIGLFDETIRFTTDYYTKRTTDLLGPRLLASESGFRSVTVNAGEIKNKGLEIAVQANFNLGELNWAINTNASFEKNEFVSLGKFTTDDITITGNTARIVGQSLGSWYVPQFLGIYQTNQATEAAVFGRVPGDPIIEDVDGDGVINNNLDRRVSGLTSPNKYFGITNTFRYKNLDLSVFFQGAFGHRIFNNNRHLRRIVGQGFGNFFTEILDHWTPANPSNTVPSFSSTSPFSRFNGPLHTGVLEKADYVRLQNVSIGYNFTGKVLDKLKLSKLRLYLSGQNIATFTEYTGQNPESLGSDNTGYPISKSYRLGINIGF